MARSNPRLSVWTPNAYLVLSRTRPERRIDEAAPQYGRCEQRLIADTQSDMRLAADRR